MNAPGQFQEEKDILLIVEMTGPVLIILIGIGDAPRDLFQEVIDVDAKIAGT